MLAIHAHPPSISPLLVDAREAARLLAISPRKLWSLTKAGAVPSMRVGRVVRYRVQDLDAWTRSQTHPCGQNGTAVGTDNAAFRTMNIRS